MNSIQNNAAAKPALLVRPSLALASAAVASRPQMGSGDALLLRTGGTAVAPTHGGVAALGQMQDDPTKFDSPETYQNYVKKLGAYISSAKSDLAEAQSGLDAETQAKNDADAEFGKPLRAAQKVLNDTQSLFQAPITRISNDLNQANQALSDAVYPGKRHADQLDAQAQQLQGSIENLQSQINAARYRTQQAESSVMQFTNDRTQAYNDKNAVQRDMSRLASQPAAQSAGEMANDRQRLADDSRIILEAGSNINNARAEMAKGNMNVAQLQQELTTKTTERNNTATEASRERARKTPDSDPQVTATRARVEQLQGDLAQAQATFEAKTKDPKAKLAQEQATYQQKMAPFIANVNKANVPVQAARAEIGKIADELDKLKNTDIGFWKKQQWKTFKHFDLDQFWKTQGAVVQSAVNLAAGRQ
jgi:hypothetical protein